MAVEEDEKAAEEFKASIERKESTAECLYNRAICYIRLNRAEEAEKDLAEAAETAEEPELAEDAETLLEELRPAMEEAVQTAGQEAGQAS